MKLKKVSAIVLAASMVLGMTACASKSSGEGNDAGTKDEEITLQFWEMNYGSDDSYLETFEKLIEQYE